MTDKVGNTNWAGDIRRQVYELISILVLLVAAAAGYDYWTHYSIERIRHELNDYHLIANSHYLRAMEELRNLQTHHGLSGHGETGEHTHSELVLSGAHHSALHFLADYAVERSY